MQETIGQRLKAIRLSRQISIEKAAEATRVRAHYLQALEADNYSAMSSAAQGRGFLRLYADYLGLDLEAAMNELRQDAVDAPPAISSPALSTQLLEPTPAPQTPSASPSDEKAVRRPFWSRLLRRPASEEPVAESESAPEPVVAEEPYPAPVSVPATEPPPPRAKKPASKKAKAPAKTSKAKTVKPKAPAKKADKKKASLKSKPSKKSR